MTPESAGPLLAGFISFVRRYSLPVFFVLVFLLTWPLQIVDALGSHGIINIRVPLVLQIVFVAYMPTVAALIVCWISEGRAGVKQLFRKLLIWRVGAGYYAFALGGFAVFCAVAILLSNVVMPGTAGTLLAGEFAYAGWMLPAMIPALFLATTLVNGEELAWRGYALPRLQSRWSALTSSFQLGLVWIVFHLPLWLTYRGYPFDFMAVLSWSCQLLGASIIFTWLYNNTRGSVLLAYLLHGSINTWTRVFGMEAAPASAGWLLTALVCAFAVGLMVRLGGRDLRRSGSRVRHIDFWKDGH